MVDNKTGVVSKTLRKPLNLGLILVLILLVGGFVVNSYLEQQETRLSGEYIRYVNELKAGSQETAKNAAAAADGQIAVFEILSENKLNFDTYLAYLKNGNPLQGIPASAPAAQIELNKIKK